jgi:signal transduction histidine kinase
VGKGMGLGLYILYGIVKEYGGQIDIKSEEGLGTTVKISFPII